MKRKGKSENFRRKDGGSDMSWKHLHQQIRSLDFLQPKQELCRITQGTLKLNPNQGHGLFFLSSQVLKGPSLTFLVK